MSSEEERVRHSKRRKRNVIAKHMFENKGAFAIKAIDPRKDTYKRVKLRVEDIELNESGIEYDETTDGGLS